MDGFRDRYFAHYCAIDAVVPRGEAFDFDNDAAQLFQFRHYAGGTFPIIDGDLNFLFNLAHHEIDRAPNFVRRQSREASLTYHKLRSSARYWTASAT